MRFTISPAVQPDHDQQAQVDTESHCNNKWQHDKGKSHARPYRKLRQTSFCGLCFAFFMQHTVRQAAVVVWHTPGSRYVQYCDTVGMWRTLKDSMYILFII